MTCPQTRVISNRASAPIVYAILTAAMTYWPQSAAEAGQPTMLQLLDDQTCDRCPMLVASRRQIVHGYGDPRSRVVFVGEAPGRHGADRTGTPFSGDKSGRALQRILL